MNNWLGLKALTIIVGALISLVIYANRAGRNAARVKFEKENAQLAQQVTRIVRAMAQAEINKPITAKELIDRLNNGKI
ncbi:hypothetical protein [Aristophania vespae]|uniref:hypothetical protein n=1 Tax=Aristophania vespae TaxID=2697033 RepID=UPI0023513F10|nr:hypothetical protein [Aristophania vespae]UMM63918.1 hypothetical protein DM15PD_08980 [Aristophania vespae]